MGIIDNKSQQLFQATIDSVLQLGEVHMLTDTYELINPVHSQDNYKVRVLGKVVPACYP